MPDFFVRITYPYSHIKVLVVQWGLKCTKLVVYEHKGDKTEKIHCHLVVIGSSCDKKQLRNIGQKYCDLKGNKNCAFSVLDSERKPLVYMTKGILDAKYLQGFSIEDSMRWKTEWIEPAKELEKVPWAVSLYALTFPWDKERDTDEYDYGVFTPEQDKHKEKFSRVLKHVNYEVLHWNNHLFTQKACMEIQMLMKTYCYRWEITIPQDYKKRFLV